MEFFAGFILGALIAAVAYELGLRRGESVTVINNKSDSERNYYD